MMLINSRTIHSEVIKNDTQLHMVTITKKVLQGNALLEYLDISHVSFVLCHRLEQKTHVKLPIPCMQQAFIASAYSHKVNNM